MQIPVYDPSVIEPKWQRIWADQRAFEAEARYDKPSFIR